MVTGKGKYSTDISLKKFSIDSYFEIIETGIVSGPSKPQGIQKVIDFYKHFDKDEFIYVGDVPSDISASRKIGIPVISVAWAKSAEPKKLKDLSPNEIFYSITEFSEWLNARI